MLYVCVLLERKIRYALGCVPPASRRWLLNKQFATAKRARVLRTLRKIQVREIRPQTVY